MAVEDLASLTLFNSWRTSTTSTFKLGGELGGSSGAQLSRVLRMFDHNLVCFDRPLGVLNSQLVGSLKGLSIITRRP